MQYLFSDDKIPLNILYMHTYRISSISRYKSDNLRMYVGLWQDEGKDGRIDIGCTYIHQPNRQGKKGNWSWWPKHIFNVNQSCKRRLLLFGNLQYSGFFAIVLLFARKSLGLTFECYGDMDVVFTSKTRLRHEKSGLMECRLYLKTLNAHKSALKFECWICLTVYWRRVTY